MARTPKYPGLQQRYQQALVEILAGGKTLKAREIVEAIKAELERFKISSEEAEDLDRNFANYTARAKDAEILVSSGPWGGYRLAPAGPGGTAETGPGAGPKTAEPVAVAVHEAPGPQAQQRRYWESLLHFPLTIALSSQFSARVTSLPTATDSVRWGNPDMLMLRPSPLARVQEYDPGLEPKTFSVVDVSPECILASIEVKGGLDRDRAALFTAIAEAAANSRWANEAWLVFVDWTPTNQGLDEDVVSLARSVEVGLLEVRVRDDTPALQVTVHYAPPTRATLRVGELTRDRVGVLRAAQEILRTWESPTPTFLDVDFAAQKARLLAQQALGNLRGQVGFTNGKSLRELLQPLRDNTEDADFVRALLRASVVTAALAGGVEPGAELVRLLGDAADNSLVKKEADAFRADIGEVGEAMIPPG
jgi:hypothetical protein